MMKTTLRKCRCKLRQGFTCCNLLKSANILSTSFTKLSRTKSYPKVCPYAYYISQICFQKKTIFKKKKSHSLQNELQLIACTFHTHDLTAEQCIFQNIIEYMDAPIS